MNSALVTGDSKVRGLWRERDAEDVCLVDPASQLQGRHADSSKKNLLFTLHMFTAGAKQEVYRGGEGNETVDLRSDPSTQEFCEQPILSPVQRKLCFCPGAVSVELTSCSCVPSDVLKIRMSVPLVLAVARRLPSRLSARQASSLSCARMKYVFFKSYSSTLTCWATHPWQASFDE